MVCLPTTDILAWHRYFLCAFWTTLTQTATLSVFLLTYSQVFMSTIGTTFTRTLSLILVYTHVDVYNCLAQWTSFCKIFRVQLFICANRSTFDVHCYYYPVASILPTLVIIYVQ